MSKIMVTQIETGSSSFLWIQLQATILQPTGYKQTNEKKYGLCEVWLSGWAMVSYDIDASNYLKSQKKTNDQ